jgi:urea transport system permease protein
VRSGTPGGRWLLTLLLAGVLFVPPLGAQDRDADFLATLGELRDATFLDKGAIVERLGASGHASARPVLAALLDDRLWVRESDRRVFIVKSADDSLASLELVNPLSLTDAGSAPRDQLTKIGTNNSLRKTLRIAVARFDLSNADAAVRLAAVQEMLRSLDDPSTALLRRRAGAETDPRVKTEIDTGLALVALDGGDRKARLDAVATLAHRLGPDARNHLAALLETSADGSFVEQDAEVRRAATVALRHIDRLRAFYAGIETLFFGLSVGSVLVLVATGLAITFGVMGVINMAHGELMMLGAYTTYVVQILMPKHIGASILVAIPEIGRAHV